MVHLKTPGRRRGSAQKDNSHSKSELTVGTDIRRSAHNVLVTTSPWKWRGGNIEARKPYGPAADRRSLAMSQLPGGGGQTRGGGQKLKNLIIEVYPNQVRPLVNRKAGGILGSGRKKHIQTVGEFDYGKSYKRKRMSSVGWGAGETLVKKQGKTNKITPGKRTWSEGRKKGASYFENILKSHKRGNGWGAAEGGRGIREDCFRGGALYRKDPTPPGVIA